MSNTNQSACGMMRYNNLPKTLSRVAYSVALVLSVSACGDSDLTELNQEKIEFAVQEANEGDSLLVPAAALPANTGPEPSAATRQAIEVADYSLVFNDEFNGSEVDAEKWNTSMSWGEDVVINDELQHYVDTQSNPDSAYNPFTFDGEAMTIFASETPAALADTTQGQPYVSGALTSLGKFDFSYGYVEARVDVPEGAGLWSSLWMLGTEFEDLKPQLYVMEHNGAIAESVYHNYNYTDEQGNLRSPRQHEVVADGFSTGWQTIGLRWSEEELVFYVNGFPTFQVNGENVASQSMYLLMNLAVGGIWVDAPDASTPNPAEMKVDYIRVYQSN